MSLQTRMLELDAPDIGYEYDTGHAGFCPQCNAQLTGRKHACRFHRDSDNYQPMGAQFLDEFDTPKRRRRFGERLDEGFQMLLDSGWEGLDRDDND